MSVAVLPSRPEKKKIVRQTFAQCDLQGQNKGEPNHEVPSQRVRVWGRKSPQWLLFPGALSVSPLYVDCRPHEAHDLLEFPQTAAHGSDELWADERLIWRTWCIKKKNNQRENSVYLRPIHIDFFYWPGSNNSLLDYFISTLPWLRVLGCMMWDLNQGFKAKVQFKDGEDVVVVTFP